MFQSDTTAGDPRPAEAPLGGSRRVLLVVDDEKEILQAIEAIFCQHYRLLVAARGCDAVKLVEEQHVDVVILDIVLPDISGLELLQELKRLNPALEAVMLTGHQALETARDALRRGACDYLYKPLDVYALRESVARAMHRRGVTDEIQSQIRQLKNLQLATLEQQAQLESARSRVDVYASVLHDINGPLMVIAYQLEQALQELGADSYLVGERLRKVEDELAEARQQIKGCVEVSHRYLRFLRQRTSENPLVAFNPLLRDVSHVLRTHPALKENQIEVHPIAHELLVRIHGTDLLQIMLNLVVNAFQCMSESHRVTVSGQCIGQSLDLEALTSSDSHRFIKDDGFVNTPPLLALAVEDDGPGMTPEILRRIFEPYFTTKEDEDGTGLGLTIVRRLVREAHGAIHLYSSPGHGTTFTVFLPAMIPISVAGTDKNSADGSALLRV